MIDFCIWKEVEETGPPDGGEQQRIDDFSQVLYQVRTL
jgi:hypothetical protein